MLMARLYLAMFVTALIVLGISSLVIYGILVFSGEPSLTTLMFIIGFMVVLQWLLSPYIINAMYHVHPYDDDPVIAELYEEIARRSGFRNPPRLMIAEISIPNAFAYGNMFTGYRVAVTRRLLEILEPREVAAVLGHELGHIRHRDVAVMMVIGLLPAIILWLGEYLLRWGWLLGYRRDREGGGVFYFLALGAALVAIGFVLNVMLLYFSRLREYYADAHSAAHVENGAYLLQRALAKILVDTGYLAKRGVNLSRYTQMKTLFIQSPDYHYAVYGDIDHIIEMIKHEKPSLLKELFSSHPHPAKRFRFLDQLASRAS